MTRWKGKIPDKVAKMVVNPDGHTLLEHEKRSKMGNKKCEFRGVKFDSIRERNCYIDLLTLQTVGDISFIGLQPRLDYLITYSANGKTYEKPAFYRGDFKVTYPDGHYEIWDAKGFKTEIYKRKKKIIEKLYGIEIIEK